MPDTAYARRTLLKTLALAPTLAVAIPNSVRAQAAAAGLISSTVCLVSPELTEGPYYFDPALVRTDITEGKPGLPLLLRIQVVTADCTPVADARVDIWHCDADGNYSGYENQSGERSIDARGMTFLRGTQSTDASGVAAFTTIFPGWYRGRTTHVHAKVFLDEKTVLTSQIFFGEAENDRVYGSVEPYSTRTETRDVLNANDGIAQRAGDGAYADLTLVDGQASAAMVLGIDRGASSGKTGLWQWLFGQA